MRIELKKIGDAEYDVSLSNGFPLLSPNYKELCKYEIKSDGLNTLSGDDCGQIYLQFRNLFNNITDFSSLDNLFKNIPENNVQITLQNKSDADFFRSTSVAIEQNFCTVENYRGSDIKPCACQVQTERESEICSKAIGFGERLYQGSDIQNPNTGYYLNFKTSNGEIQNEVIVRRGQPNISKTAFRELLPDDKKFIQEEKITTSFIDPKYFIVGTVAPDNFRTNLPQKLQTAFDRILPTLENRKFLYLHVISIIVFVN